MNNYEPDPKIATLGCGRNLAYIDTGPSNGPTVLFFHGSGSSRTGLDLVGRVPSRGGRLISPARPGIGKSDPDPDRTLSSWAADIEEVTNQLGVDEFAVLGVSGGAAYAAAVAHALPARVTKLGMLSCGGPFEVDGAFGGMARPNRMIWWLADRHPRVLRTLLKQQATQIRRRPAGVMKSLVRGLTGPDAAAVNALTPEAKDRFFAGPLGEALQDGPGGLAFDMTVLRRPWDFSAAEIDVSAVLWHGTEDTSAPIAMARWLAAAIAVSELHVVDGGGHISVILEHIDQAIDSLLAS